MIFKNRISAFIFLISFILLGFSAQAQLLLNEIVVNPPGSDEPFEFIELKGNPGITLNNMYVCVFVYIHRYFSKLSEGSDGANKRRKIEEALEGGSEGEDNAFEDAFRR